MLFDAWPLLAAPAIREPMFREPFVPLWAAELTASVLLHLWLFCVGACVGSFLNVVVYRLPRGKSLSHPGSCCPQCGHAIRLNDNVPILSWLWLWGRCRDCRAPISPRYFWVELLVASVFLGVSFFERSRFADTFGLFLLRPQLFSHDAVPYWCRYATHVVEMATLIGGVLILGDGFRTPVRLFVPAILLSLGLALIWPEIRSVPAWNYGSLAAWQQGLIDGLAGMALGLVEGAVAAALLGSQLDWPTEGNLQRARSMIPVGISLGAVLGWQRTLIWATPILLVYALAARWLLWCWPPIPEPKPAPASAPAGFEVVPPAESIESPSEEPHQP